MFVFFYLIILFKKYSNLDIHIESVSNCMIECNGSDEKPFTDIISAISYLTN